MKHILTVGITSYKRVDELIRCINSIQTKYVNDIEIVVSEDSSPLSNEIENAVKILSNSSVYNIRFTRNGKNLGYDTNLGAIIKKAEGKYVFLLSDDDAVSKGYLDEMIPFLRTEEQCGVIYAPFIYMDTGKMDRNRNNKNFRIPASEDSASKYIYDSILFSGLVFRKDFVKDFDSSRFKNYNYFQVYMFLQMMLKYGGYYFTRPSVLCIGDRKNAYGLSESSVREKSLGSKERNEILANRCKVKP